MVSDSKCFTFRVWVICKIDQLNSMQKITKNEKRLSKICETNTNNIISKDILKT